MSVALDDLRWLGIVQCAPFQTRRLEPIDRNIEKEVDTLEHIVLFTGVLIDRETVRHIDR